MKLGVIFPGYGSQFVGMGKELYDNSRLMQEYFEEASNCLNVNFVKLCFASSDAELAKMHNAYPAIFLVGISLYALIKELGISADIVAGYNTGEYAALFAAGGLSLPDGLYLLNKYATFYTEAGESLDLAAIQIRGISQQVLEKICASASEKGNSATIASFDSPTQFVVAGPFEAVEHVRVMALEVGGVKVKALEPEVGVHSPLMESAANNFKIYLEKVDFKDLTIPLISAVDGQVIKTGEEVKARIVDHITRPVQWIETMEHLLACDLVIEVGPGTALSALMKDQYPTMKIISINKQADIDELQTMLGKQTQTET